MSKRKVPVSLDLNNPIHNAMYSFLCLMSTETFVRMIYNSEEFNMFFKDILKLRDDMNGTNYSKLMPKYFDDIYYNKNKFN